MSPNYQWLSVVAETSVIIKAQTIRSLSNDDENRLNPFITRDCFMDNGGSRRCFLPEIDAFSTLVLPGTYNKQQPFMFCNSTQS